MARSAGGGTISTNIMSLSGQNLTALLEWGKG